MGSSGFPSLGRPDMCSLVRGIVGHTAWICRKLNTHSFFLIIANPQPAGSVAQSPSVLICAVHTGGGRAVCQVFWICLRSLTLGYSGDQLAVGKTTSAITRPLCRYTPSARRCLLR